ncbi:MAG: hypothetical protein K6C14_04640 [Eubacterium sp.]|nr:hypothetical protein [Eubacterium sp.]
MLNKLITPQEKEKTYKVTILLSRYNDPFSRFIKLMSRCDFTHASICVDEDEETFYSFNLKGFVEEHWKNKRSKHLMPDRKYIRFYVSEEVHEKLRRDIEAFRERKSELSYSAVGTILSLFKIPSAFKNRYFCSRFIAEILHSSGAYKIKRNASLYLPVHFYNEFI